MADAPGDAPASTSARERSAAIRSFAERLREVRSEAGNPSFREMAGRSRVISHTTLHEAAQGHRLPSWATVVEFAKACGSDPAGLREPWEQADRAARRGAEVAADQPATADTREVVDDAAASAIGQPERSRRRLVVLLGGGMAALAVVALVLTLVFTSDSTGDDDTSPAARVSCPVQQPQPAPRPPTTRLDRATYIRDVTVRDCSHIDRNETFEKIWRFRNDGVVAWRGYSLRRLDGPPGRGACRAARTSPIPYTPAGRESEWSVRAVSPDASTFCFVRFVVVNGRGQLAFPGGRPIFFQVYVD